jgi:zinc transport system permease protein
MTFFQALLANPFLQLTLLAGFLSSIAGGIIGTYVIVKRIAFISGSISHAVLGGMGVCLYLQRVYNLEWLSPIYGALASAIAAALLIGWARRRYQEREDSLIAAVWAVGMAIGLIFVAKTPGYNVELMSFLLGNIVWTSATDLIILGGLDLVIVVIVFFNHAKLMAICFDEDQAQLQGVRVDLLYMLLLVMVAVSVVLLIQMVGIVLVMTMLTIPAAVAGIMTHRLSTMMIGAVALSTLFSLTGTWISYELDWPVGATIALLAGAAYFILLMVRKKQAA